VEKAVGKDDARLGEWEDSRGIGDGGTGEGGIYKMLLQIKGRPLSGGVRGPGRSRRKSPQRGKDLR